MPYDAACECRGGRWPGWGSEVIESLCHHLLGRTRCSEIFIARSIHDGLRGAYCCTARLFRGQTGRPELLRTVQRDESQWLQLLCCSIV
jgi:hypothetical protein